MEEIRELGEQPLALLMRERGLRNHDLVEASSHRVNHKMVARAASGRRVTVHTKQLVLDAYNLASGEHRRVDELFNYGN